MTTISQMCPVSFPISLARARSLLQQLLNECALPLAVSWSDLPPGTLHCRAAGCTVRDIYTHKFLAPSSHGFTASQLASHDSAFLLVSE